MRRQVLIVFALAFVPVRAPAQQFLNFWTQCTAGSLRACASVDVTVLYHPTGPDPVFGVPGDPFTELRIRITNPQGLDGHPYGPRGLRSVRFYGFMGTTLAGDGYWVERTARSGSVTENGQLDPHPNLFYGPGSAASPMFNFDYDSYLFGCDVPSGASPWGGYDATCGGSITYSVWYRDDQLVLTPQAAVQLHWATWDDDGAFADGTGAVSCTSGVDCVTVTPEPATLALVATGMAGLAAYRRRRRQPR